MNKSSETVQLIFSTYHSTLPKGQKAPSLEEMQKLLDTALVDSGDGGPPMLQITPMHPGMSFSMSVAPQLSKPFFDGEGLTVDTAMALLGHMQLLQSQQNFISNSLRANSDAIVQSEHLEEQQDTQMKAMDAQAQARAAGISADGADTAMLVATIFAAVLAIAFAAFFGGVLAIAVAATLGTMAGMEGASAIARAAGATREGLDGKRESLGFTISDLTKMAFEQDVKDGRIVIAEKRPGGSWVNSKGQTIEDPHLTHPMAQVMTPQEYQDRVTYVGLAVNLLFAFGTLAGGIGAALLPIKMQKIIQNVANLNKLIGTSLSVKQVQLVANAAETAATLVESGTAVGAGSTQIVYAVKNYDVEKLKIAMEHVKQLIAFVVEHMELLRKSINEEREKMQNTTLSIVRSIGEVYQGQVQIAHNITPIS